jgi:predicted glycoside hydrolase/deacetylase ChbG (UPF0249 family)
MSASVNRGVLEAFRRGWITSATLMCNMPGFREAVDMIRDHGLGERIGLHLVLNEGPPLTEPIRRWRDLVSEAGELRGPHAAFDVLAPARARAVEVELEAQIQRLLAAGIRPTHFDSHGHVHTRWAAATIVMRLARRHHVPAIRLTRNCGPGLDWPRRLYKQAFNRRLALAGFAATRRFGSAADAADLAELDGALEIMTHPDRDTSGDVVDRTPAAGPLASIRERWAPYARLMSYRELCATAAR